MNIQDFLSHPLLLLLVGAGVSSYLIPWFTNKWQDHKKETDLKIDLISNMSDIIALATGHAHLYRKNETMRDDFHKDMLEWLVKASNSRSQLRVYFPDATILGETKSKVSDDWNAYLSILSVFWNFCYESSAKNFSPECKYEGMDEDIKTIKDYFQQTKVQINWNKLCSIDNEVERTNMMQSILSKGDEIIRAVIVSRPRIF
jgi:hypothetical protein